MSGYFDNFPLVDVKGVGLAKNIIARPKIDKRESSTIQYNIAGLVRPDQLANVYYHDQALDWVVYLANNIIDPYYDYFMNEDAFQKMIISQYRSLDIAAQTIVNWKTNWRLDGSPNITPATYLSLPTDVKSFYNATTNDLSQPVSYTRKRKTLYKTTNMIVVYLMAVPLTASPGIIVTLGLNQGQATVVNASGNLLTVQHVTNNYNVTTVNGISASVIQVVKSISDTQAPYFSPVSAYDAAYDLNESRRSINVIPSIYAETIKKELKRVLK